MDEILDNATVVLEWEQCGSIVLLKKLTAPTGVVCVTPIVGRSGNAIDVLVTRAAGFANDAGAKR